MQIPQEHLPEGDIAFPPPKASSGKCQNPVIWLSTTICSLFKSPTKVDLFICLFIWGFTSLSTLYRSYHDG